MAIGKENSRRGTSNAGVEGVDATAINADQGSPDTLCIAYAVLDGIIFLIIHDQWNSEVNWFVALLCVAS